MSTARQIFGTVPCLRVPRLPLEGSLGTPKILSTGTTLHLGPIRLHVRKLGVPCPKIVSTVPKNLACRADFFSACKWGLSRRFMRNYSRRCSSGNPEAEAYFYCFFLFPCSGMVAMF